MIITKQMEEYIKLQRTGYGGADIARCFEKDIYKDLLSVRPHLPKFCKRILDIGCGVGGIDLYLYNHFKGLTELHMLDYSRISKSVYYGYQHEGAVYNSLDLTADFLKLNGVDKKKIAVYDAENKFPSGKFDIILSILSCGFHYPVETYIEKIKAVKSGIVILDIRKNSGQIKLLQDNFESVEVIADYSKCERVLIK